jgi:hypothetical protein
MFVFGGLALLTAGCMGGMASSSLLEQAMNQPDAQLPPGMTIDDMRLGIKVFAGIAVAAALVFLVLGAFVRRGSKGAAVTSIVVTILALGLALLMLGNVWMTQPQQAGAGTCMMAVPIGLLVWLLIWLFGASAAAGRAAAWPAQYGGQYQQYQQAYPPQPGYPPQQGYPPPQQGYPSQQPQVWQQPGQWQQQPPPPPPPPQNWPPPQNPG